MNNYEVAHKFFYDLNGNFEKSYLNVSYNNYKFYSYYTCIGKVVDSLDGRCILLVSENDFSNTTSKHIGNLLGACPFDFIYVPVNYGDNDIDINNLENKIIKQLNIYKNSKLTLKENRDEYCRYYTMLCDVSHRVVKIKKSNIAKYRDLYLELQDISKIKELKKKQRAQDRKAREKARKKRIESEKALTKDLNFLGVEKLQDYINFYYNKNYALQKFEIANISIWDAQLQYKRLYIKLKDYFQDNFKGYDFVWTEGENFKTSKSVIVKIEDCLPLIKLYKENRIKHGLKLNQYTVLEVKNDYIKIGCHKISRENLDTLLKEF
jgi:hypothetical protein